MTPEKRTSKRKSSELTARTRSSQSDLQPAIRVVMMPSDTNPLGTIFGGIILSYIDQAGAIEVRKQSDQKFATVALHEVKFLAPVLVGDLVSFYTETLRVGRTSLTILVTVEAWRGKFPHQTVRVTQAEVIYVAIKSPGKPTPVRLRAKATPGTGFPFPGVESK